MTLIIGLVNRDQAVLVSDRRLTKSGNPVTEESNKAGVLICRDARVAIAFAGLAEAGPFRTNRWLWEALCGSAGPDFSIQGIVSRFCDRASRDIPAVRVPYRADRRLSVVIAGYVYDAEGPRSWYWLISNCEDWSGQSTPSDPTATFRVTWGREKRPREEEFDLGFTVGTDSIQDHDLLALRQLCQKRKPASALVQKTVAVLRATARRACSRGLIGQQCTSIVLPSDISRDPISEYHTAKATHIRHDVTLIEARGGDFGVYCLADPETRYFDTVGDPVRAIMPKVGRNAPCPCKNGRKYKHCHGR